MTDVHRRAFLGACAALGVPAAAPAAVFAQIKPGTTTIGATTIREAARLAGHDWSEAECLDVAEQLSSLAASIERIEKAGLTNASPLPLHFDPRPPGVATAMPSGPLRLPQAPRDRRPARLEDVAFWPATHLAALVATGQATSLELTEMYQIGRAHV